MNNQQAIIFFYHQIEMKIVTQEETIIRTQKSTILLVRYHTLEIGKMQHSFIQIVKIASSKIFNTLHFQSSIICFNWTNS